MKTKIYFNTDQIVFGMTLKDVTGLEENNMALHVCNSTEDILQNRRQLAQSLQCAIESFICANQTHSANFYKITKKDRGRGALSIADAIQNTDALYTYEPNLLLCTFTADCVPVIFYNEQTGLVGVIHSGWQGTVKEITLKVMKQLIEEENNNPKDIKVFIGPALSQEKFEVDTDVYLKFLDFGYANEFIYFNETTNKYHIDNQQTVKKQCELMGIPSSNITIDSTCTFKSPDGFSYRQDKKSGRHLSFIMRKASTKKQIN